MIRRTPVLGALLLCVLGSACGESGEKAAHVVEAASKAAAETVQQAAEQLDLAHLTPQVAKAKVQELVDLTARELAEVKDSAAVERITQELQPALDKLGQLKQSIAPKLHLAELQKTVQELIEDFQHDPRVQGTLKTLQEKLQTLAR